MVSTSRRAHLTRAVAVLCAVLAPGLSLGSRTLVGPPGALVHIRWESTVDEARREALERRFQLEPADRQGDNTWRYDLRDTSSDNIRSLVTDDAVADTHYIDRVGYAADAEAVRTSRPQPFSVSSDLIVRFADVSALLLLLVAGFAVACSTQRAMAGAGLVVGARTTLGRVADTIGRSIARWIPDLDGTALAAFRIALGCGFVWVALSRVLTALPLEQQRHRALVDLDVVHQITASQPACNAVQLAMVVAAVLFAAGVFARVTYAAFVGALALSTLITLERTSAHDLGLPLVTYLGWLTVPWNAPRTAPPRRSTGFAIWWPGLTVGVALLAAAYWKLHQSGLEWITGGAVKYHFIADAGQAHVDWGLWVAAHHGTAVILSLGAIVVEAVFILNIFARGPWTRLASGMLGAGLFVSLYLFQGIYWPGWHVLFLAFLPWSLLNGVAVDRHAVADATAFRLRTAQIVVVVILLSAQVFASAFGTEAEPLMSNFPMYAHNYRSVEDFEASMRPRMTRVVAARADGEDIADVLPALVDNDRFALMDLAELPSSTPLTEAERRARERLCEGYPRTTGTMPEEVTLTIERKGFDWQRGRFRDFRRVDTKPVPLAALCRQLVTGQVAR